MKVLVTGSNGFIAKNLIQSLSEEQDIEILCYHRQSSENSFIKMNRTLLNEIFLQMVVDENAD
ncbi:NAD-dependent epimerase/dehydratase family protein, partial [Pasteurella multocida]|uniref:NAD-dependent epimerase/dehydratase family protein n=1 Tax=Pasteurella multocida TaxID=747 RepID=UPI002B4BA04D